MHESNGQTDELTDRQDYYGNTALCTNVHRAVKSFSIRSTGHVICTSGR